MTTERKERFYSHIWGQNGKAEGYGITYDRQAEHQRLPILLRVARETKEVDGKQVEGLRMRRLAIFDDEASAKEFQRFVDATIEESNSRAADAMSALRLAAEGMASALFDILSKAGLTEEQIAFVQERLNALEGAVSVACKEETAAGKGEA
jgi:hypothetical protein